MLPHPVPSALADIIALRFRALSEPMRIRIVDALRDGPATVQELAGMVGSSPQNVSKHLAVLADAGVIDRERQGNSVVCDIRDTAVLDMCEQVCGGMRDRYHELATMLDDAAEAN